MNMWMFLSFGAVAGCAFLSIATWAGTRHQERKDFYRGEMLKKLAESGPGAVVEYLREEEQLEERRRAEQRVRERDGLRLTGLILIAVGSVLTIALWQIVPQLPVYILGLTPVAIGVVFLGVLLFGRRSA